jgi:hypothetical protein
MVCFQNSNAWFGVVMLVMSPPHKWQNDCPKNGLEQTPKNDPNLRHTHFPIGFTIQ